jgi:hypothetical protein
MIHYIKFPPIPNSIVDQIPRDVLQYSKDLDYSANNYFWSKSFTTDLESWCKENICSTASWGIQVITGDLPVHKDVGTISKFIYIIDAGGSSVTTTFYDNNKCITNEYIITPQEWHILKADTFHSVTNVEQVRISVSGRIY